jgi:hypothetical protein
MANHLPVLMLHALEDSPAAIAFPPRLFRQGLERLRAEGYRVVAPGPGGLLS